MATWVCATRVEATRGFLKRVSPPHTYESWTKWQQHHHATVSLQEFNESAAGNVSSGWGCTSATAKTTARLRFYIISPCAVCAKHRIQLDHLGVKCPNWTCWHSSLVKYRSFNLNQSRGGNILKLKWPQLRGHTAHSSKLQAFLFESGVNTCWCKTAKTGEMGGAALITQLRFSGACSKNKHNLQSSRFFFFYFIRGKHVGMNLNMSVKRLFSPLFGLVWLT